MSRLSGKRTKGESMSRKRETREESKPEHTRRPFVRLTHRDVLDDVLMWAKARGMSPEDLEEQASDWMDEKLVPIKPERYQGLQVYEEVTGTSIEDAVDEALSNFINCCVSSRLESIANKKGNASHGMN
jgi:hypothetical protein